MSLPNILTYGRIAAVPALVAVLYFMTGDTARWTAFALFAAGIVGTGARSAAAFRAAASQVSVSRRTLLRRSRCASVVGSASSA